VGGATVARLAELNWGQGFLSWCGSLEENTVLPEDSDEEQVGLSPGDACINKDGTPGTVKTPASTIKATLDKVLGGTQDKLAMMGQLSKEVGGILSNIGKVFGTIQLASSILGGPEGGLFGMGQATGPGGTTRIMQYQNTPTLNVTPATVYKNASEIVSSGSDMAGRLTQYETAWTTIRASANAATVAVTGLASFCTAAASKASDPSFASVATAQASAAQSAITTQITPVLTRANTAFANIASARAALKAMKDKIDSGLDIASEEYLAELQALQTMPPTDSDLGDALSEVEAYNSASASPAGSLAVSGGSIVDRMSLISSNAEALKSSACTESLQNNNRGGGGSNDG